MNQCKIVEDLLPLYIEELTSDETSSFVEEHLQGCEKCAKTHRRMTAPVQQEEQNVNYKKSLWMNMVKIVGKVLLTVFVVVGFCAYGLWEWGYLDREWIESPDGGRHFEVLDTDAGFFSGGAYIVTPDGRGRNLYGDTTYQDFNVWFSPNSELYFAWITFEDHDETYLVWQEYGYADDGTFEYKDTHYPAYEIEKRDFLGEMERFLREDSDMAGYFETVEFEFNRWSDNSRIIYFSFETDTGYVGTVQFNCEPRNFVLTEAYYPEVRRLPPGFREERERSLGIKPEE